MKGLRCMENNTCECCKDDYEWNELHKGQMPIRDDMGSKIYEGDQVILFSRAGIHYEGKVVLRGGYRWFEVDEGFWIGGLGSMGIMRDGNVDKKRS